MEGTNKCVREKDSKMLVPYFMLTLRVVYSDPIFVRELFRVDIIAHIWVSIFIDLLTLSNALPM